MFTRVKGTIDADKQAIMKGKVKIANLEDIILIKKGLLQ